MFEFTIEKIRDFFRIYQVKDSNLIRVGRCGDGGYVVPEVLLSKVDVLYNYGVGNEITFEQDFLERYPKKKVMAFDHTISKYPKKCNGIKFHKEGLSAIKDEHCSTLDDHFSRFGDINKRLLFILN